ncbi:MAG: alpha-L-fucosidase [Thermoleophilaceae bacterium]|nr:alpha-L-fucosidase [Thermoleophilaceae bacterium]
MKTLNRISQQQYAGFPRITSSHQRRQIARSSGKMACLAAFTALLIAAFAPSAMASSPPPSHYDATPESLAQHPIPDWWANDKFGIMIHWGVFSVPAYATRGADEFTLPPQCTGLAEWYWFVQQIPLCNASIYHLAKYGPLKTYDNFIPQFNPTRFNPDSWIRQFKRTGAKYFVLIAKHHDGFALWCSRTTHRDSCEMGPRRDLVSSLFSAAHRAGDAVKPGVYYSIPEWFNPAPRPDNATDGSGASGVGGGLLPLAFKSIVPPRNAYTQLPVKYTGYQAIADYAAGQVIPQMKELIKNYRPSLMWCDIGGNESYYKSNTMIADYYNASMTYHPEGVAVNDRCGDTTTHGDYTTIEEGKGNATVPFETLEAFGVSQGYNAEETEGDYKTSTTMIADLVNSIAKGGNYLLGIGPKADGTIPPMMATRMDDIGAWMAINGESVYNTHTGGLPAEGDLRFTAGNDGSYYITALAWPGSTLTVNSPVPLQPGQTIKLLGSTSGPLDYTRTADQLIITTPEGGDQAAATTSKSAFVFKVSGP